tara:strand:- start:39 stop:239 length:201 start_codon:yes stop_codon:yes gene_type:complete
MFKTLTITFETLTITKAPSGRFIFVGRVHESLCNKFFETIADAKVAAIDCMMKIGETFPVAVSANE